MVPRDPRYAESIAVANAAINVNPDNHPTPPKTAPSHPPQLRGRHHFNVGKH